MHTHYDIKATIGLFMILFNLRVALQRRWYCEQSLLKDKKLRQREVNLSHSRSVAKAGV